MGGFGGMIGGAIGAGAELLITHGARWQEGWAIGTVVGTVAEGSQRKRPAGRGKLNDLHVGGSAYGTTIPRLWGKAKIAGSIIWVGNYLGNKTKIPSYSGYTLTFNARSAGNTTISATVNSTSGIIPTGTYITDGGVTLVVTAKGKIKTGKVTLTINALSTNVLAGDTVFIPAGTHLLQHKKKVSSGGGGSGGGGGNESEYWYSASFAVMVCEGTLCMDDGTFVHRSPVFKKIWANDQLVYDVSNPAANKLNITFYTGTEIQTPNSLIEGFEGAGSTPGYRGMVYFVVEGMDLSDYGSTIPNFQVELWTSPVTLGDIVSDILGTVGIKNLFARTTASVTAGATSIPVAPLAAPLIVGSTIVFGSVTATLNQVAPLGSTTLQVNPLSGGISLGANGPLKTLINTSLATVNVPGYPVTDLSSCQDIIDQLLDAFSVDLAEIDGIVKLVPRGGSITTDIDNAQLGAVSENSEIRTTLARMRQVRGELHSQCNVTYMDIDRLYQQSSQQDLKQTAKSKNVDAFTVPFSLTATIARQMAARKLETEYAELDPFSFSTTWRYEWLSATDLVNITDVDGITFRVRILDMEEGEPGEIIFNACVDYLNTNIQIVIGDGGSGGSMPGTNSAIPTTFKAWSGTELQDEDTASPGLYIAATGPAGWLGGTSFYSTDGGTTYNQGPTITDRSIIGTTTGVLTNGTANDVWDLINSVGIALNNDGFASLETSTEDAVLNGNNIAIVGSEILGYVTANLTGLNTYDISHLRRGMRKSSYISHSSGEKFVVATSAIARINLASSYAGTTVKVKVVSPYETLADVTAQDVVISARSMTPYEAGIVDHASLIASASVLGHVKIGSGLTIDPATGILSVNPLTGFTGTKVVNAQTWTITDGRIVSIV